MNADGIVEKGAMEAKVDSIIAFLERAFYLCFFFLRLGKLTEFQTMCLIMTTVYIYWLENDSYPGRTLIICSCQ